MMLNFQQFSERILNESDQSESYQIPGVKDMGDGGYEIIPIDVSSGDKEIPRDQILISKKNDHSIAFSYLDKGGKERDYLWVPKDAISVKSNGSGEISSVIIDPNKRWITIGENKSKMDDFIEDFADHIENSKKYGSGGITQSAKDDVELFMEILDIPGNIRSFESCGDYRWEANLDNGMVIDVEKRDRKDLVSRFKIYLKSTDHNPCVDIQNSGLNKKTSFRIPGMDEVTVSKGFTDLRNSDPYIKFLTRKAINSDGIADREALYNHFLDHVRKNDHDSEKTNNLISLLSTFMNKRDIDSAYAENRNL